MGRNPSILDRLEKVSPRAGAWLGIALIMGMGSLDYVTGDEIAFSLFYLIPISLLVWLCGRSYGVAASMASAFVWLLVEVQAGQVYSHPAIYVWNSLIRLGFFIVVTFLLAALRSALKREQMLARTDHLTGALNARSFSDLLQMEVARSARYKHPFSLAYIDLDDFKAVNDQFGHTVGDDVLRLVVLRLRQSLRRSDVIARLGGDEFALLMPETDRFAAEAALAKLRTELLDDARLAGWPVSLSVGVVTCQDAPASAHSLLKHADDLMYSVKRAGKNSILYSMYDDEHTH